MVARMDETRARAAAGDYTGGMLGASCRILFTAALATFVAASSLARAEPSTTEPPKKGRRTVEEPTVIEVLNFVDEVEPDPQAFAVGLSAGLGVLATKGSDRVVPGANFAFTFDR